MLAHQGSADMVILVALRAADYGHCLAHELDTHQGIASHEQLPALPAAHFLVGAPRSTDSPGRFVAALALPETWHWLRLRLMILSSAIRIITEPDLGVTGRALHAVFRL